MGDGKGNYLRIDGRATVDQHYSIDIKLIKQNDLLHPGTEGNLRWSTGNETTKSGVDFSVHDDCMIFNCKYKKDNGPWEYIKQKVKFDFTSCNYGGFRYWFLCPGCGKRARILYGVGKYFLCRDCCNLTYGSKLESKADQANRKAQHIRKKLGIKPRETIFKPKGMHWKTFYKLKDELLRCESFFWADLAKKFGLGKD